MDRFFLTTAIDYVNSRPHLGTAYEKICADVIARYKRLSGVPTRFLMGNDEHSQNVYRKARELGLEPLAYCDQMEREFRDTWKRLDISYDDFIRTTEERHKKGVTDLILRIQQAGDLYSGVYEGWYCESCEAFKPEKDLVDGKCPIHVTQPEWIREENIFFRLSKYQQRILEHVQANPHFIRPEMRRNEILRLLEGGLEDISVSRTGQHWGIPVPFLATSVVYVWFDALVNYASAVGLGTDNDLFAWWWPADLHVVGKDITRFHCVIWPAMLMSAGFALPRQVFAHGWVHFKGQKMSKSLGTVVDPLEAAGRFGPDPLRLYLVKEIAYGHDGDFSWDRFEERYNVDLANNLGNLVNRVAVMVDKYREGQISPAGASSSRLTDIVDAAVAAYRRAMDEYALQDGAAAAYRIVDASNEFIAENEPWALARDPDRADHLSQVLHDSTEAVRIAAVLLLPIMPGSAAEILRRMGETRTLGDLRFDEATAWSAQRARVILKAPPLWPRLESARSGPRIEQSPRTRGGEQVEERRETAGENEKPSAPLAGAPASAPEASDRISIDDFMKVELRVAKVLAAERVPNARKLLKIQIDLGSEQRTVVAGIAEGYEPEALVGRSVVVVANLKPAKLMGVESNGMLLAASPDGGRPMLVGIDQEPPPGTRVR